MRLIPHRLTSRPCAPVILRSYLVFRVCLDLVPLSRPAPKPCFTTRLVRHSPLRLPHACIVLSQPRFPRFRQLPFRCRYSRIAFAIFSSATKIFRASLLPSHGLASFERLLRVPSRAAIRKNRSSKGSVKGIDPKLRVWYEDPPALSRKFNAM
ncbi:hypothetical protein H5410_036422, partial [Solanum commersonii]